MQQLLLAQLRGLSTLALMQTIGTLVKWLMERNDSSFDEKDAKTVVQLLKKKSKEDKDAGFTKVRSYSNVSRT